MQMMQMINLARKAMPVVATWTMERGVLARRWIAEKAEDTAEPPLWRGCFAC